MTTHDDTTGFPQERHPEPVEGPYAEEAKQRWGHTDAYKESQKRVGKMTKEQFEGIGREADEITKQIAALADRTPNDPQVQALVARHYQWLRHFYEPSLEMYRGLGSMYADDPRFAAHYDKYGPGMAAFMRDAMHAYCDAHEAKNS